MIDLSYINQKSREKFQINKIRNEKEFIATNTNKIHRKIREYFKNLYSNKLGNLEEMDKFLDSYNGPKLPQEGISHLNRSIPSNDVKAMIKSLSTKKSTHTKKKY
jgi:hypothetical protein